MMRNRILLILTSPTVRREVEQVRSELAALVGEPE